MSTSNSPSNSTPVKCVTTYADSYANTGLGNIVAMCIVQEKDYGTEYIIQEPLSLKTKYKLSLYDFAILPENLAKQYPVGFYTTGSHYKILKQAGYADFINSPEFYERISKNPEYDSRSHTWYSDGLQLKEGVSETQTHLYHI